MGVSEILQPASLPAILDVRTIYLQDAAREYSETNAILARFPSAEIIPVASHWRIPELHGNTELQSEWNRTKRTTLVLGVKGRYQFRPNGRSADYIGPGTANGCAMSCAYCYVARRKGAANPITLFVNIEAAIGATRKFAANLPPKPPSQTDPEFWTFDIGENSDVSLDAALCDGLRRQIEAFRTIPNAKATFATKFVNRDLLTYDPQRKTRVRFSLMPSSLAKVLDVRTSPIAERIAAIDDFVAAGYEVHLNLSPVVIAEDSRELYRELFRQIDDGIGPVARAQLRAEIIFLTHNEELHEANLQWHPKAEEILWRPDLQ
ncbi:spore photoproduct lyase family protein, partial [bacterium]